MTPLDHTALVVDHLHLLPVVAARLGARPSSVLDRDDFLQAGAMGLLQAARVYDPAGGATFSTFAWTCAAHAMLTEGRAVSWQRYSSPRGDRHLAPLPETTAKIMADPDAIDPAEAVERSHQQARVRAAVDGLPPHLAAVVRGYWFDGLEQREIAERLGVDPSRVSRRLRRAYRLLAVALRDDADQAPAGDGLGVAA